MKKCLSVILSIVFTLSLLISCFAEGKGIVSVTETDGNPELYPWQIKFSNGSVTDNGDGTATVTTGVGGGGDVSSNTASSIDSEIALFSGIGGKTIKRATQTGILKATSGMIDTASPGTDYVVPTGNVATATALATARAINGQNFDGTGPITTPVNNANDATNADYFALFTSTQGGNYAALTSTGLKYHPSTGILTATGFSGPLTGNVTGNASGSSGSCTGNAATVSNATLTTALTNNGGAGTLTWPAAGATLTIPTGGGTLGTAAFTASTAYDVAGAAAAVTPTTLSLVIGTNTQAYDADLTTYAGITPTANAQTLLGETFAQMQASLSIDDLITLSGVAEGSVNLGTFTGSTIADNVTNKAALQALETAVEGKAATAQTFYIGTTQVAINRASAALTLAGLTLTTPDIGAATMSGNLSVGENGIILDPAISADGKYSGITEAGTAGATLAFGDLVYFQASDSRWELVDANVSAGYDKKLGICVLAANADGDATTILLYGKINAATAFPTLTVGSPVYMSETAGDVTMTAPVTADSATRIIGVANTADELQFQPSNDYAIHT